MDISIRKIIDLITKGDDTVLKRFIEMYSRNRIERSFYTLEEITISLLHYIKRYTPQRIAEILGMSRSNVYAVLKRFSQKYEKAVNTINLYEAITNVIYITVRKGEPLDEVARRIYSIADKKKIKIPFRGLELINILERRDIVDERLRFKDNYRLILLPNIDIIVEKI